ncbi:hypothetical protein J2S90_000034 [Arthrobacter bambusae]|uniref:Uncharacterized protein n=1 Tax=Arthrobacter bambusae TaxID=1338426 RepID=A0AAW8D8Z3_9MICC|nr:hypothetical protein [Arthrobacter bambusae]MDQ0128912.1 hypothetical protein [Arthrobacter bambusae]MDQ0180253.1 hypothetical protein [Arthrobacter bambusae]
MEELGFRYIMWNRRLAARALFMTQANEIFRKTSRANRPDNTWGVSSNDRLLKLRLKL